MTKQHGFTLIELLIAVVIIGILASIAYPSYVNNTRITKRTTAQADLVELASFLERRFTENNSYLILNGSTDPISGTACATPAGCTPSLANGITHKDYLYSFSGTPTSTAFTVQAIPQGRQTSDTCGTLSLSDTGVKTPTTNKCWR